MKKYIVIIICVFCLVFSSLVCANDIAPEFGKAEHFGGWEINIDEFFDGNFRDSVINNGYVYDGSVGGYWYAYISGNYVYSNYTPNAGQSGRATVTCGGVTFYGGSVTAPYTSSVSCAKGSSSNYAGWQGWW